MTSQPQVRPHAGHIRAGPEPPRARPGLQADYPVVCEQLGDEQAGPAWATTCFSGFAGCRFGAQRGLSETYPTCAAGADGQRVLPLAREDLCCPAGAGSMWAYAQRIVMVTFK